jgi:hypothetical protein
MKLTRHEFANAVTALASASRPPVRIVRATNQFAAGTYRLILAGSLAAGSPAVWAGTYHVAQHVPQASDANPGTEAAPWKTLSKAAAELAPGETVVIHEGVYREWVNPARSGSPSAPIVFQGAAGDRVVLTGADVISGWVPSERQIWKKEPWQHRFATHPNDEQHRLVGRCEQLIADGQLLKQVEQFQISLREQGPRTCRSVDGGQATYHVHDVTVRRNICALNSRYQVGLWWDNSFFGPHPSASRGSLGTAYDPDQQNIRFDENVYWAEGKQAYALWGCPWRPKHKPYADFAAWRTERNQDGQSLAANPQFLSPDNGDWRLQPESPARQLRAGSSVLPGVFENQGTRDKEPQ